MRCWVLIEAVTDLVRHKVQLVRLGPKHKVLR